jgi:hypothetical protein
LDYLRAFRLADTDVKQMLEDSRPKNVFPEAQQYVHLLKEAQQWRLNFGYTAPRARFLEVGQLAAETLRASLEKKRLRSTKSS